MDRDANRLIDEKSPYLLQHAHNPVDWQPWSEEAFNQAALEDKPVFLSIGYSTCHWCHVMAHESFEDDQVAELLNRHFVSIKVDREERPDIDAAYMTVCQMMTGSGGWPLTIILTPEKKPFFSATYLPKKSALNRVGLLDLLPRVISLWNKRREEIYASANQVTGLLAENSGGKPGKDLKPEILDEAAAQLALRFDNKMGGFGPAPKFPSPHNLSFLLRHWLKSGEAKSLEMVEKTLTAMARGGIFDHLGYGFHRYATDADWLLPHFEKMLYDQALICLAYLEAFQATGKPEYAATAEKILEYVVRDLTSPQGGFYSAEDADSEGREGRFYVWTTAELDSVLGAEEAEHFGRVYNFQAEGNFNEEAGGHRTGANILHLKDSPDNLAPQLDLTPDRLRTSLAAARDKLLAVRSQRVRPSLDDKILTDWNGLMIAALGRAARVLGRDKWSASALKAVEFIKAELFSSEGGLLHRWRDGQGAVEGFADDYACLVWGLIELHQATQEPRLLNWAVELTDDLLARFWDKAAGGLFLSAEEGEEVLTRRKEIYDGARPSANSVAAANLIRLARITGRLDLEARAMELMRAFAGQVVEQPGAYTGLLSALDLALAEGLEVVVVGRAEDPAVKAMLAAAGQGFRPHATVLFRAEGQAGFEAAKAAEFTLEMTALEGRATAYVCTNRACGEPTTDLERMKELMSV